jgi:solute carrier family 12 (sodium/chloride transporter), member 3
LQILTKKIFQYFDCCSASPEEKQAFASPTPYFNGKVKPRTIDVYWLFDDGGLTILIPFLLTKRQFWSNAKLRIFTPGKEDRLDQDKLELSRLLTKLRIEAEVDVITDLNKPPSQEGRDKVRQIVYCS